MKTKRHRPTLNPHKLDALFETKPERRGRKPTPTPDVEPAAVKRPRGRPKTTDNQAMPPVLVRLPDETTVLLRAWAAVTGVPAWRLVDDAIRTRFAALPAKERGLIGDAAEARKKTAAR